MSDAPIRKVTCPICNRNKEEETEEWPFFPFCSQRCKNIDLGRWLGEEYRVPAEDMDGIDIEEQGPS